VDSQSSGYLIIAMVAGLLAASFLYFRNRNLTISKPALWLLFGLRFLSSFILVLLLLNPLIKLQVKETIKPVVIMAMDNSASIAANNDSLFYINDFPIRWNELSNKIESYGYSVEKIRFSKYVELDDKSDYSGTETNLGGVLKDISIRYARKNAGALIVASDGIITHGPDPLYYADLLNYPVYTICLGDTRIYKDLRIADLRYNEVAFKGNDFLVELYIEADKCDGVPVNVSAKTPNGKQYTQTIRFNSISDARTVRFVLNAENSGLQRYHFEVSPLEGERTIENNKQSIVIEVLESQRKVLIIAATPHPDIASIKNALEGSKNLEIISHITLQDQLPLDPKDLSLAILVQLPHNHNHFSSSIQQLKRAGVPLWYILGNNSNLNVFNTLSEGLKIENPLLKPDEIQVSFNSAFNIFHIQEEWASRASRFSPLSAPFGDYKIAQGVEVMLYRSIGGQASQIPVWIMNTQSSEKTSVLAGEGIWRWRMQTYQKDHDFELFDQWLRGLVGFLSLKDNRSPFRVNVASSFNEGESVRFSAQLFNPSLESVTGAEIELLIRNEDEQNYQFLFSPSESGYSLNAGTLPEGIYRWQASTILSGKKLEKGGQFVISPKMVEYQQLRADHNKLRQLSLQTEGKSTDIAGMEQIAEMLNARSDLKSILRIHPKTDELVSWKWLLVIALVLLFVEWALRKLWTGS
jgi:hypothetical protein